MDRRYSIEEIDRMRLSVTEIGGSGGAEDRLRTYMLNGTDPDELERRADQKRDVVMERQRQMASQMERDIRRKNRGTIYECDLDAGPGIARAHSYIVPKNSNWLDNGLIQTGR